MSFYKYGTERVILVGTVTCHKEGCNQVIPLKKRVRARDGGKRDGFGSLSEYRVKYTFSPNVAM